MEIRPFVALEELIIDRFENHPSAALSYENVGVFPEEVALERIESGKRYTRKDCWAIAEGVEFPQYRISPKKVKKVSPTENTQSDRENTSVRSLDLRVRAEDVPMASLVCLSDNPEMVAKLATFLKDKPIEDLKSLPPYPFQNDINRSCAMAVLLHEKISLIDNELEDIQKTMRTLKLRKEKLLKEKKAFVDSLPA